MDTNLTRVVAALAELRDGELGALIHATNNAPQIAPGLLAWIESACDWELHRRRGFDFPLRAPEAAIPPDEDAVSIDAAASIRAQFADDGDDAGPIVKLFDAIVGLLMGDRHRH